MRPTFDDKGEKILEQNYKGYHDTGELLLEMTFKVYDFDLIMSDYLKRKELVGSPNYYDKEGNLVKKKPKTTYEGIRRVTQMD